MTALPAGDATAPDTSELDPRAPDVRLRALGDPGSAIIHNRDGAAWAQLQVEELPCVAFALDPRTSAGSLSVTACTAIREAYTAARTTEVPIVGLWHSSGAHLGEGVESLDAVAQIFAAMTAASGHIPQISVILGPAAGGAAYGPALTDVVVTAPEARVFITGPAVIRTVTGEQVSAAALGGPDVHGAHSGVSHVQAADAAEALAVARNLVGLLRPGDRNVGAPVTDTALGELLPSRRQRAYDIHPILDRLLDSAPLELQPQWAPNLVVALGRIGGRPVGVVANNPIRKAGCLDARSAEKAARFVRMCDAFGLPLIVLVDVPGYLPGVEEEWGGVVRRGAKLLHAFAEARVPTVTVVLRKAFGGAYIAMNCRSLGAHRVLAWPGAEIAVMGAPAAVRILHKRELADHPDPVTREAELAVQHARRTGTVTQARDLGLVDEVIDPDRTRSAIAAALADCEPDRGDHRNIPL